MLNYFVHFEPHLEVTTTLYCHRTYYGIVSRRSWSGTGIAG